VHPCTQRGQTPGATLQNWRKGQSLSREQDPGAPHVPAQGRHCRAPSASVVHTYPVGQPKTLQSRPQPRTPPSNPRQRLSSPHCRSSVHAAQRSWIGLHRETQGSQ